jgi:hypothetical protein
MSLDSSLQGPHCTFESNRFDTYASITCTIDGDLIVGSQDVLYLNEVTARLNRLSVEDYTRDRDFIRESW